MEQYDEDKAEKAYKKHKCRPCVWARWQTPYVVSCLFPRCVIGDIDVQVSRKKRNKRQ